MLNRWHLRIGSWLGLLAILMTTLAPTISQTLAARAGDGDAMAGEHCQMASMASMPSMDNMAAMPGMPIEDAAQHTLADARSDSAQTTANTRDDTAGKHTRMSAGDACGYCSLLAHLPAMPAVETLFVAAVRARRHTLAPRFYSVRRVEPPSFAQPRAPPAFS